MQDLDISLPNRPESSPMSMPAAIPTHSRSGRNAVSSKIKSFLGSCFNQCLSKQVLIEAGSASSADLSPHFSNAFSRTGGHRSSRNSRDSTIHDVESELEEAMSETVLGEESLLDGE